MASDSPKPRKFSVLDLIEWVGNKLPDPVTLFAIGAVIVMVLSWAADRAGLEVAQEMLRAVQLEEVDAQTGEIVLKDLIDPETGQRVMEWQATGQVFRPNNLLSRDGVDWAFRNMVDNFRNFPPLGVVLVGMLGIGVAERTGLLAAVLKAFMLGLRGFCELFTPRRWNTADKVLTPAMVFIGVMSSIATDAGYVVLPPLAAALYKSVGRSPLAGLAAVFAGVSGGFSANLVVTGLEPMLAELTGIGATIIEPGYRVNPMCNWWFMIASTVLVTFAGWFVTAVFVERRLKLRSPEEGGPDTPTEEELADQQLKPEETRGLMWAGGGALATLAITLALILVPGAPLYTYDMPQVIVDGQVVPVADQQQLGAVLAANPDADVQTISAERVGISTEVEALPENAFVTERGDVLVPSTRIFDRWVDAIVPLLFFGFLVPGLAYGMTTGQIASDKDLAKVMMDSMAAMAPIIVLAFVAGQFISYFSYSGLDRMLAMWGGMTLGKAGFSPFTLIIAFILVTLVFNLFMGSMSAKYTLFAPIFVPMFMMVGISPELTQAAYRVGDSVSNIITPLNAYLVIILVFMQRYVPKGGMGTLIATMFPYTVVFAIVWTIMLLVWMVTGLPLGIDGALWYDLQAAAGNG